MNFDDEIFNNTKYIRPSDYVVRSHISTFADQFRRILVKVRGYTSATNADKITKVELRLAGDELEKQISSLVKDMLKRVENGEFRK